MKENKKITSGFTMIEILVVVTIIGILFGVGIISYSSITQSSRDARRKTDLEQIRAALEMWRSAEPTALGQYPDFPQSNCSDLNTIVNFSEYLPQIPEDPKAASGTMYYVCESSANTYSLYSVLEAASTTDCGVSCGDGTCEYAVGPYGKTCGP